MEERPQKSWASRTPPDHKVEYLRRLDSIWHYIQHAAISTLPGQRLRSINCVQQVGTRAIELAALRLGLEAKSYRQVHLLPESLRRQLVGSLPKRFDPPEVLRALEFSSTCFFEQAAALDTEPDSSSLAALGAKMHAYVAHLRAMVSEKETGS